jgi:hypothetical protein
VIQQLHTFAEQHPWWNWAILVGSAAAAWLAPIAALVTIALGCLQIYLAVEKRWFRNAKR